MAPSASILIPTRPRPDYLEVALASVAPAPHEIVVVEDGPADARSAATAVRHGAHYVALGGERGINAARNAALDASRGELACFIDDDVEVWPGWLDALLGAAAGRGAPRGAAGRGRRGAGGRGGPRAARDGGPPGGAGAAGSRCRSRAWTS